MSLFDDASLAMIPSAYKDGKLYSIKPTDGSGDFIFTRGSNLAATRVDVNGLIEKGRENLLTYSNTFNVWGFDDVTRTSGQSGYDNSNDAWLIQYNTTASRHSIFRVLSPIYSDIGTISIYAKAKELQYIQIASIQTTNQFANFDLSDGSIGDVGSDFFGAKAESIGNGWYRLSVVNTRQSNTIYISLITSKTAVWLESFSGANSTDGLYIQDAQLEQGLVATDYIETTTTTAQAGILEDMPRLDYSGGASCPSLLLEPQRTNLVTDSEYFNASGWFKLGAGVGSSAVVTDNYAMSPEGVQNATRLQLDLNGGTTSSDQSLMYDIIAVGAGDYTRSIYVKSNDGNNYDIYFGGTLSSYEIKEVTSEWTRIDATRNFASSGTGYLSIGLRGSTGCSDTADILIYGAQVEQGSYPTSYIPTYGTSQTRSKDIGNVFSVGDLLGQEQGTMFVDFVYGEASSTNIILQMRKTTGASRQIDFRISGGDLVSLANSADASQFYFDYGTAVSGTRYKAAVRYGLNDSALYVNGSLIASDTTCDFSEGLFEQVTFNESGASLIEKNRINQALFFPTALTDSECIALTTL